MNRSFDQISLLYSFVGGCAMDAMDAMESDVHVVEIQCVVQMSLLSTLWASPGVVLSCHPKLALLSK
jgi:hypothetical protein